MELNETRLKHDCIHIKRNHSYYASIGVSICELRIDCSIDMLLRIDCVIDTRIVPSANKKLRCFVLFAEQYELSFYCLSQES